MFRFTWKMSDFLSKRKGKEGVLCAPTYSSFFGGPVGHNLCPKKCLTTSKKVGGGGGGGGACALL